VLHGEPGVLQRGSDRQRRLRGHGLRDAHGRRVLLAGRGDLLDEPEPERGDRVEFVAGEQVAHGVAPARALDHADGGAARGHDAALHLELAEAAIGRRDHDIGGQHQLDSDGVGDALYRGDQGLGAERRQVVAGIDLAGRDQQVVLGHERRDLGQIQAGREVLAFGMEQGDAGSPIVLEGSIGGRELLQHLGREAVHLGRTIDSNDEDRPLQARDDLAVGVYVGCGAHRCLLFKPGIFTHGIHHGEGQFELASREHLRSRKLRHG
jgi:hypothetical protein